MPTARRFVSCVPCKQFGVYYGSKISTLEQTFGDRICPFCGGEITIIVDYLIEYSRSVSGIFNLLVLPKEAADRLISMIISPNDIAWWTG